MAASASSQHRCVFVGNIPYDATEEQLMHVCEEVGPVASFRLVIDRETGKPKGYGFCEYKDEETALSARRNLQGYEINGHQLRVDFAKNDKNSDRNREQGHGGPGLTSNAQKQLGGPSILGDSTLHQPMGLPLAATASSLMAEALGGVQTSGIQNGLRSQSGIGNDPLTHFLAGMSRHQLNEIMSEIKALFTQNKALALQLLQGNPQLPKALFQAQIMLGMMTPQMMQMMNSQQSSFLACQPSSHLGQASSQKDAPIGMLLSPSESQMSNVPQNPTDLQQSALLLPRVPLQPQHQHTLPLQAQILQGKLPGKHEATKTSSIQPQPVSGPCFQPNPPVQASKSLLRQFQPPLRQHHSRPTGAAPLVQHPQLAASNTSLQQSLLPHPSVSRLPPEMESALLQQVLSLTPEQLSSLPVEQRQQVLQLQQMLSSK